VQHDDIVNAIMAADAHMSRAQAERVYAALFGVGDTPGVLARCLAESNTGVLLMPFGRFRVKWREARRYRDMMTDGSWKVLPRHRVVVYQPSAALKRALVKGDAK